jgi:hypothetical protein
VGADLLLVKLGVVAFGVFRDSYENEWDSDVNVEPFTELALFEPRGVFFVIVISRWISLWRWSMAGDARFDQTI